MLALFIPLFISYSDVQTVLNSPTLKVPKLEELTSSCLHILKFNNISVQKVSFMLLLHVLKWSMSSRWMIWTHGPLNASLYFNQSLL